MKKLLGLFVVAIGTFMFTGLASASTTDILQPASGPTYDGLTVNGTATFDSIKVGKQGVGGVTFFNGTIINITTDEDNNEIPVTFGDDVRIDGRIWRGETAGPDDDMPVIINDDLEVEGELEIDSYKSDSMFQIPWLDSKPTTGCSSANDVGKFVAYERSGGNSGVANCMKVGGDILWLYQTIEP